MPFIVAKVGQNRLHDTIESATAEAVRLTRKNHDERFYVAELIRETKLHVEFSPIEPANDTSRTGLKWSFNEDAEMLTAWMSGIYTITDIAKAHKRTPFAIQCRLEKYGYDPYTTERYKG